MKQNSNTLIVGRHVCLLPYTARHVAKFESFQGMRLPCQASCVDAGPREPPGSGQDGAQLRAGGKNSNCMGKRPSPYVVTPCNVNLLLDSDGHPRLRVSHHGRRCGRRPLNLGAQYMNAHALLSYLHTGSLIGECHLIISPDVPTSALLEMMSTGL
jgi:hypothetical protein